MKKEYRIKKSSDFDSIIRKKKSFANRQFVIYFKENELDHMRLGISVSKKLGKAYKRNKLKRYVRECFKIRKDFIKNYDVIIIVRKGAVDLSFEDFDKSINHVLKGCKLLR
ncbi:MULTISPECIES: ribonuclease P protein component [Gemella]|uniref:ribonuclease P protein component n=1 Tax=Gemella TaxID=1378 RepID=UPI00076816DD|nr:MULTISPECIES: ribonuclease P protein component [Gemella]AME08821.1 ribonuclease P protein component [Gemella sp. oral taxon 928]AXI26391.1 ribonuclease P protein component [Gemella sp. ND 6198]